jgi:hypothetical protein
MRATVGEKMKGHSAVRGSGALSIVLRSVNPFGQEPGGTAARINSPVGKTDPFVKLTALGHLK